MFFKQWDCHRGTSQGIPSINRLMNATIFFYSTEAYATQMKPKGGQQFKRIRSGSVWHKFVSDQVINSTCTYVTQYNIKRT